jgi:hypothetical protein
MDRRSGARLAYRLAEGGGRMSTLLRTLARIVPTLGGWARRTWRHHRRLQLIGVITRVLWVSPDAEWAGTLLYLRGR